jgi:hypothetical protein
MKWSGVPLPVLYILAGISLQAAELRITVTGESGRPVWARLEVRGPDFQTFHPQGALMDEAKVLPNVGADCYYAGGFVVEGQANVEVPPGHYTIVAEHGLEYERVEKPVDVTAEQPATVSIQLRPWINMRKRGWYSGDMHVHRPLKDIPSLALAEDLNISVVITMWNLNISAPITISKADLLEGKPWPVPAVRVTPNHFVTLMNAEDERNGGAWIFHGIREPLGLAVDSA